MGSRALTCPIICSLSSTQVLILREYLNSTRFLLYVLWLIGLLVSCWPVIRGAVLHEASFATGTRCIVNGHQCHIAVTFRYRHTGLVAKYDCDVVASGIVVDDAGVVVQDEGRQVTVVATDQGGIAVRSRGQHIPISLVITSRNARVFFSNFFVSPDAPPDGTLTKWMPGQRSVWSVDPNLLLSRIGPRVLVVFVLMGMLHFIIAPLVRQRIRSTRLRAGRCPECGYPLRAVETRCSECGWNKEGASRVLSNDF